MSEFPNNTTTKHYQTIFFNPVYLNLEGNTITILIMTIIMAMKLTK